MISLLPSPKTTLSVYRCHRARGISHAPLAQTQKAGAAGFPATDSHHVWCIASSRPQAFECYGIVIRHFLSFTIRKKMPLGFTNRQTASRVSHCRLMVAVIKKTSVHKGKRTLVSTFIH
jgi:hypothetical protein